MDEFGLCVKTELIKRGLTQRYIAKQLKLSDAAISMYIEGKSKSKRFNNWVKKNLGICLKSKSAFTLMEMMISMVVISILMAASLPMITQFSTVKTGVDKNVSKCIVNNTVSNGDGTNWYTDATGNTSEPTTEPCKAAVTDVQYDRGKAVNTAEWFAGVHGTAAQKLMAKKILRAACDLGGHSACDYFINKCWTEGSTTGNRCDDTTDFTDITYYVHQHKSTNLNLGATYIYNQLENLLPKMIPNLLAEVTYACNNVQVPNDNQNLGNNLACELSKPWVYIKGCNNGYDDACETAYDNDYNKSCYQVKTAWEEAPTGIYKLTYNADGDTEDVECTMYSLSSAAISGCNGITANLFGNAPNDDCSVGYTKNYNQDCNQVATNWYGAPSGSDYTLTTAGVALFGDLLLDQTCTGGDPNCTDTPGLVCLDGSIYAGSYNGYHMFVPPYDEPCNPYTAGCTPTGYTWNSGITTYQTRYAGFIPLPTTTDGRYNSDIIKAWTSYGNNTYLTGIIADAPYRAAGACNSLNDVNYLGHNDWYLPSYNELSISRTNKTAIGNFSITSYYWSSLDNSNSNAERLYFGNTNHDSNDKNDSYRIRCMRNDDTSYVAPTVFLTPESARPTADCSLGAPATPGTLCTNDGGTIYAGSYSGSYYYTTPNDEAGTYYFNNGTTNTAGTGAYSTINGETNTATLVALSNLASPYQAAVACNNLNSVSYLWHNDWFLPATNEMVNLYTYRTSIGSLRNSTYWTSTDKDGTYAYYLSLSDGTVDSYSEYGLRYVRCMRKD